MTWLLSHLSGQSSKHQSLLGYSPSSTWETKGSQSLLGSKFLFLSHSRSQSPSPLRFKSLNLGEEEILKRKKTFQVSYYKSTIWEEFMFISVTCYNGFSFFQNSMFSILFLKICVLIRTYNHNYGLTFSEGCIDAIWKSW